MTPSVRRWLITAGAVRPRNVPRSDLLYQDLTVGESLSLATVLALLLLAGLAPGNFVQPFVQPVGQLGVAAFSQEVAR